MQLMKKCATILPEVASGNGTEDRRAQCHDDAFALPAARRKRRFSVPANDVEESPDDETPPTEK